MVSWSPGPVTCCCRESFSRGSCIPVFEFEFKNCVSPETTAHCRFGSGLIHRPLPIAISAVADGGLKPLLKLRWAVAFIYGHCRNGNGRWFRRNTVFKLKLKNSLIRITFSPFWCISVGGPVEIQRTKPRCHGYRRREFKQRWRCVRGVQCQAGGNRYHRSG